MKRAQLQQIIQEEVAKHLKKDVVTEGMTKKDFIFMANYIKHMKGSPSEKNAVLLFAIALGKAQNINFDEKRFRAAAE